MTFVVRSVRRRATQPRRGTARRIAVRATQSIAGLAVMLSMNAAAAQPAKEVKASDASPPAAIGAAAFGEGVVREVARIRAATAEFRSLDAAVRAGYARDVAHCVDNPPAGAMGYHHQNDALLDDRIEVERPEMLVYERLPDGTYQLNGVEYIVPLSVWPETREPPVVMGQALQPAPSLGIWYRHVWVWRENPSGLFADWNPLVKC
jgi:hypothetical protein